jgi:hypothetical protein
LPMKTLGLLLAALALTSSAAFAKSPAFKADAVHADGLTREQAKELLLVVLSHANYKLRAPGAFIDGDLADDKGKPPHPGYYDFSVGSDSAKEGATNYRGLFSVSILTGDVWEINLCKRFVFPQLRRIQAAIMKKTGKTLADEKSERKGLGCTDE